MNNKHQFELHTLSFMIYMNSSSAHYHDEELSVKDLEKTQNVIFVSSISQQMSYSVYNGGL